MILIPYQKCQLLSTSCELLHKSPVRSHCTCWPSLLLGHQCFRVAVHLIKTKFLLFSLPIISCYPTNLNPKFEVFEDYFHGHFVWCQSIYVVFFLMTTLTISVYFFPFWLFIIYPDFVLLVRCFLFLKLLFFIFYFFFLKLFLLVLFFCFFMKLTIVINLSSELK